MGSLGANHASFTAIPEAEGKAEFQPLNPEDVRAYLHKAVDFISDYYTNVESMPVLPDVKLGYLQGELSASPPIDSAPFDDTMKELRTFAVPRMTHWASPNFFAFFPSTNNTAAIAGDLIASAMNTVGFTWQASPAATEMEVLALDWLAQLLRLPATFMNRTSADRGTGGSVILGTTSEAILVMLVAMNTVGFTWQASAIAALRRSCSVGVSHLSRLVVYATNQTHSIFFKACRLAGFDPANFRSILTEPKTNYGLHPAKLLEAMQVDAHTGLVPAYGCVTVGTTSSNDVDPVGFVADIAAMFDVWVHVDAAYAGSACICPELCHHLDGVECVDSISIRDADLS